MVAANCWGNLTNCGGMTCDGLASRPGEVEILLAALCYKNLGKKNGISSGSYEPDGSKASLFYIHLKLFLFAFRALLLKTHQLSLDAFVIALKAMQVRNHH